jgi:hypothetical protein
VVSSRFRVRAQAAATKQRAAHLGGGGRRPARDHACCGCSAPQPFGVSSSSSPVIQLVCDLKVPYSDSYLDFSRLLCVVVKFQTSESSYLHRYREIVKRFQRKKEFESSESCRACLLG